jgi:hypothetical protein
MREACGKLNFQLPAGFLLCVVFDPEDGGDIFLLYIALGSPRNIQCYNQQDCPPQFESENNDKACN